MTTKFKRLPRNAAEHAAVKKSLARGGLILLALEAGSEFCNVPHTPLSWKGWSWMREAVASSLPPMWIQQRHLFNVYICLCAGP